MNRGLMFLLLFWLALPAGQVRGAAIANPGAVDVLGVATASAVVSVYGQAAYERGEYWWKSVPVANGTGPQWAAVTNTAAGGGTSNVLGRVYVPPAAEALAYDADGNLTNDGRWRWPPGPREVIPPSFGTRASRVAVAWDAKNRLVRLETAPAAVSNGVPRLRLDFGYDWQGRRLSKTVLTNWNGTAYAVTNGSRFLYDGWNLVAELNATNAPVRSYVWGLDLGGGLEDEGNVGGMVELLDHSTGPPARYFATYDGNANLTALVKADQTVGARYEYGPFGELIRATGPVAAANPVRWSSRYWDAEADLIYYGWRYYSPAQGRWLGRDPIEEADAVNLFAFVKNRPASLVDPLGDASVDVGAALAIAGNFAAGFGFSVAKDMLWDKEPIDIADALISGTISAAGYGALRFFHYAKEARAASTAIRSMMNAPGSRFGLGQAGGPIGKALQQELIKMDAMTHFLAAQGGAQLAMFLLDLDIDIFSDENEN